MNEQLLDYIKNATKNISEKEIGLFTGKVGTSIALYIIGKNINDRQLVEISDSLLEKVIADASDIGNLSIDRGLTGIGLAVIFLVSNGYVDGDLDDILGDIDVLLYKSLNNKNIKYGISCTSGLTGFLVYLVERLDHCKECRGINYQLNVFSLRSVINMLEETLPRHFEEMTKDVYISLINNFPILFVYLGRALDLGVYNDKINNFIGYWSSYFMSYIPYYNVNKLYLAVALQYMNRTIANRHIDKYIQTLLFSIDMDELYKEIDVNIMNVNEGFFFVEVLLYAVEKLFLSTDIRTRFFQMRCKIQKKYNPVYKDFINNTAKQDGNLSLINSFIGVEALNFLYPSIFNIAD